MRDLCRRIVNVMRRVAIALGYVPNPEWLRVSLNRAVLLDRANATLAIALLEERLKRTQPSAKDTG